MLPVSPAAFLSLLPKLTLPIGVLLVAAFGCASEVPSDDSEQGEAAVRDANGFELITAKVDTHIKTTTADSTTLESPDKCFLAKGTKVSVSVTANESKHVRVKLLTSQPSPCGSKFGAGGQVYAFREHFEGWSSSVPQIVDNTANYASSCQFKAANRTASEIERIVLHNTLGHWDQFKSDWQEKDCEVVKKHGEGAAHFVVLRDGTILRTVPENNIAYHAKIANYNSIGVEIETETAKEIESGVGMRGMSHAQESSVVALTKSLQRRFGVSKEGVTMHRLAAPGTTDCASAIWSTDASFTSWRDLTF